MQASRIGWRVLLIALLFWPRLLGAEQVGAVLAGSTQFWKVMGNGIKQAARDTGIEVSVRSPIDDDEPAVAEGLQTKMLQQAIKAGARGLILAPIPVGNRAIPIELSVPLVLVDRSTHDFSALSTISTDNYAAGRAAARALIGKLPPKSKVGLFRLAPDVVSTSQREQGFIDAASELGFEVVLDTYLGHDIRQAEATATILRSLHRDRIDAVFSSNDRLTLAAIRASRTWPRELRPLLVGFDYEPRFEEDLQRGDLFALVVQDPFQMGYQAVQQLLHLQRGDSIPVDLRVEFMVVTAANLDDPLIRASLDRFHD